MSPSPLGSLPAPSGRTAPAAHALARICLGVNIFLHGLVRMPHTAAFAAKLHRQFAGTLLPPGLVHASAYGIVFAETAIGFLILVGLMLPWALGAGLGLMIVLQFGTALAQDWNVVGLQLIYVALYAALLASVRLDRYSVDGWTRRSNRPGGFTERG